jgi:hypothetical protein
MTADHNNEKWVELYRSAMLELQHSLMAGRISEARAEITQRIEKLHDMPDLHAEERHAIEDALSGLRMLEREEIRRAKDQERKLAEETLERLRSIEPRIAKLESGQTDES